MAFYGYTHETIEAMEKFFSERDIQAMVIDQCAVLHERICASNEHVIIKTGINKGRCKYCMKMIAEPMPLPK